MFYLKLTRAILFEKLKPDLIYLRSERYRLYRSVCWLASVNNKTNKIINTLEHMAVKNIRFNRNTDGRTVGKFSHLNSLTVSWWNRRNIILPKQKLRCKNSKELSKENNISALLVRLTCRADIPQTFIARSRPAN